MLWSVPVRFHRYTLMMPTIVGGSGAAKSQQRRRCARLGMSRFQMLIITNMRFHMDRRKVGVLLFASSLLLSGNTYAGLFGPSNYEDCVLDKMKGQAPNLVSLVVQACKRQFPTEETLIVGENYKKGQLVSKWSETTSDTISFNVERNDTAYKLTRAEAQFWKLGCDQTRGEADIEVSAEAPLFGSTFKFQMANASQYKCGSPTFYGKKNN